MLVWLAWLLIGSSLFMITFYLNAYHNSPVEEELEMIDFDEEPSVSILMPAYNEQDVVEGSIQSSLDIDYGNLEIIFVDDGSEDDTFSIAQKFADEPKINLIQHSENKGKGEALNTALDETDSEYVIVQDADSQLDGELIRKGASEMTLKEDVGAVITAIRPLEAENFVQKLQVIEYILTNFYRNLMSHLNILDMTPGAFSMYRTSDVKRLGGFDTDNLTEDLEIAWRLKKDGKNIHMAFHESTNTEFPDNFRDLYGQRVRWARGFMSNAYEKREMFFNKELGWFGRFQLPVQIILPVIAIIGFWLVAVGWIQGLFSMAIDLSTGKALFPSIGLENLERTLLNFSAVIYIPLIASLGLSAYELKVAYSESDSSLTDLLPLLFYFAVFFMLKGFFWMAAILKELRKSEKVWT